MKKQLKRLYLLGRRTIPAFSLTELLIALAIVGILVLIALPNLMPLITEAKSTEAKLQLKHIHMLEKRYFYVHSKYTNNLQELGYEANKLTTEGGNANYQIVITDATVNSFVAKATAVVDFDQDGAFNVWEVDQNLNLKESVKD